MTVATKLVHRGDHEVRRKPLRREGRSDSALTCGLRAFAQIVCAKAHGCRRAPGLPCALCISRRVEQDAKLGRNASRECGGASCSLKISGSLCAQRESDRLAPLAGRGEHRSAMSENSSFRRRREAVVLELCLKASLLGAGLPDALFLDVSVAADCLRDPRELCQQRNLLWLQSGQPLVKHRDIFLDQLALGL